MLKMSFWKSKSEVMNDVIGSCYGLGTRPPTLNDIWPSVNANTSDFLSNGLVIIYLLNISTTPTHRHFEPDYNQNIGFFELDKVVEACLAALYSANHYKPSLFTTPGATACHYLDATARDFG